jgi:NTE family protein
MTTSLSANRGNPFLTNMVQSVQIVISPKVGYPGNADFTKRHEAVTEGEKAALAALPKIQGTITRLKQEGRTD